MAKTKKTPGEAFSEQIALPSPSPDPPENPASPEGQPQPAPPPAEPPPAGGEPPPAAPAEPAPAPGFLDILREAGFQDVTDETTGRDRLLEAYSLNQQRLQQMERRMAELEPLANYGTQYLDSLQKQAQPASPQAAQPASQSSSWWNPPAVDPMLLRRYYTVDPNTGQAAWRPDTPAAFRAAAEAYEQYTLDWQNKLSYDPPAALREPIRQEVASYLQEVFGVAPQELPKRLDITGDRRFTDEIIKSHAQELFVVDPRTNRTDYTRFSPWGELVNHYLEELSDIADARARWTFATRLASADTAAGQPQPANGQAKQERQRQILKTRGQVTPPQRSGSIPETAGQRAQNPELSPGQRVAAALFGSA
jgi:hypothetical protein